MIDTRLYNIRWFDTTKTGKLIVRKYQGKLQQTEDAYWIRYNGKLRWIKKSECIAHVWENNQWQSA